MRRLRIHPLFLVLFGLVLGSLVVGLRPVIAAWSAPDLQFVGVIHPRAGKGAIVELQFSADAKQLLIQQTLNSSTEESGTCVIELQ